MSATVQLLTDLENQQRIAAFGSASWFLGPDGVYRLAGGSELERMEAIQWIRLFVPDAVFLTSSFSMPGDEEPFERPQRGGIHYVPNRMERPRSDVRHYN